MEIKSLFKAKRKDNNQWVEGCLTSYNTIDEIEINPDTICQSKGVVDKNGRKVFEGDIYIDSKGRTKRIFFYGGIAINNNSNINNADIENNYKQIEVIGNIHDLN